MSPHPSLHPRSRLTTSLFTTTLLLSFLVVGMPHILPCPRPRLEYSDTEAPSNNRKQRRGVEGEQDLDDRICGERGKLAVKERMVKAEKETRVREEAEEMRKRGRECPVPKPGGWVGEWLGFAGEKKGSLVPKDEEEER